MRKSSIIVAAAAFLITTAGAEGRPIAPQVVTCSQQGCTDWGPSSHSAPRQASQPRSHKGRAAAERRQASITEKTYQDPRQGQIADNGPDPRPGAWCAWWLRRHLQISKSAFRPGEYNLARGFLHVGSPAPQGCTNCVAVFSRGRGGHVGLVQSWDANGNPVILSGNFNGRVDTAPHPASRLIGLRYVNGATADVSTSSQFSAVHHRHHRHIRLARR